MQRYFVNEFDNNTFKLNEDDTYHITKVMRMKVKDSIEVVYNNELYICEINSFTPYVTCSILEKVNESFIEQPKVIIAQAIVKEQKMDYILQKSCELGVYSIVPFQAERSVVKFDKDISKKITRWQKILKEASEQSKRLNIPILNEITDLKLLKNIEADKKFVCSVKEKSKTIKRVLSNVNNSDTILFVIGPEGGLSDVEEKELIEGGFMPISLGDNVLRTETASSFILSSVCYEFMR